ncbi:initiation factor 2 [Whalleya microplaca]|nr:initiation factor 2 [Whalleya microplaca]
MLRARIPKRNTSICAFCQHRLSLRPLAPRHRSFSTTRALKEDGSSSSRQGAPGASGQSPGPVAGDSWGSWGSWGTPAFTPPSPPSPTSPTSPASPASAENSPSPPEAPDASAEPASAGQPKVDDLLSRAELLARERLLAKSKQAREAAQPPKPRAPQPGAPPELQAKYIWDSDKQRRIEQGLRNDGATVRKVLEPVKSRLPTGSLPIQAREAAQPPTPRRPSELRPTFMWDKSRQLKIEHGLPNDGVTVRKDLNPSKRTVPSGSLPTRRVTPESQSRTIRPRAPLEGSGPATANSSYGGVGSRRTPTLGATASGVRTDLRDMDMDKSVRATPSASPTQSSPTHSSPTQSTPTQSTPTQSLPTQSSTTQSSPKDDWGGWGSMAGKPSIFLPGIDDIAKPSPLASASDQSLQREANPFERRNQPNKLSDNTIYPSSDNPRQSWSRDQSSLDNTIYGSGLSRSRDDSRTTESNDSWGLLTRKPAPKVSRSEDFWGSLTSKPKATPQDPNGREKDEFRTGADLGSWQKEPDTLQIQDEAKLEPTPLLKDDNAILPETVLPETILPKTSPEAADYGDAGRSRKSKGSDRASRLQIDEEGEKEIERGRGGRGKRSRRNPRYDDEDEDDSYESYQDKRRQKAQRKKQRDSAPKPILLPELITITDLADALKIKHHVFLDQLGELGFEGVSLDSLMAGETAALVAQEYGFEPTVMAGEEQDLKPRPPPEDPLSLPLRPPVVTIMGHVDHGKTTILDYLRKSSIAAQEHGGITQHIGAFSVKLSTGKQITFLDTPGHAAFLAMRQRGAQVTDIVVLVVAADDSVKPQTLEALKHARASKVPIIVAINKIDKDRAGIDQVKHDLANQGVEIEDFGGDVQVVCVSGKTGEGMGDLEENIVTLSEVLDHRAEVDGAAEGWMLESSLKPIGKAATVLVKRGTLRRGDYIAAGLSWARIRQMRNEAGAEIQEAPPGTPVEILGWKELPAAGDQVLQAPNEARAKDAVAYREGLREREKDAAAHEQISEARRELQEKRAREKAAKAAAKERGIDADEALAEAEAAEAAAAASEGEGKKIVNFVVKGDVHGSVEAVCAAIQEIGSNEVEARILRSGTGPISEFDVEHAATSGSIIVNFATDTAGHIKRLAADQGVRIMHHNVIYHLVDDVKARLSQCLPPRVTAHVLAEAEVLEVFPINIKGRVYKKIAGCRVRNGTVAKNGTYRVMRKGVKVFDGRLETLKHHKDDVTEMRKGAECGIGFVDWQDIAVGDQIQSYEEIKTERFLE